MKKSSLCVLFLTSLLISCGGKEEASTCTKQDTGGTKIVISCIVKRNQQASKCQATAIDANLRRNEICQMGFDNQCVPARVNPELIRPSVTNGTVSLYAKDTGKKLIIKQVTSSGETFNILQQEGDLNETSSVTLPVCADVGI